MKASTFYGLKQMVTYYDNLIYIRFGNCTVLFCLLIPLWNPIKNIGFIYIWRITHAIVVSFPHH